MHLTALNPISLLQILVKLLNFYHQFLHFSDSLHVYSKRRLLILHRIENVFQDV